MSDRIELLAPPTGGRERTKNAADDASAVPRKVKRSFDLRSRLLKDIALGALIPVLMLVVWQIGGAFGWVSRTFMPPPLAIAESLVRLADSGGLLHHLGVSAQRAALGFLIGGGFGFVLGILTGTIRRAEYLLDPSLQVLRLVPHLAIAPLIILWFGFGEESKVAIVTTGAFFPLYVNTFLGIRNVDSQLYDVARTLEFSRRKRLVRLILPAALPNILLGVRLSMAVAWIGLAVAEFVGSTSGIGFLVNEAKQNGEPEVIFVGILIFAVVGKLIDFFVRLLENKWLHWRDGYQG
ncbi:ABC transporter permease [Cohnella xylanilytica]|uniref:ABC transporter permease n=1 Tax=Cohnella xylanilytica TaxID=557555 RepID=UPI001BB3439D|nr:ABC transporter permease [Cohnella xylanilytica]